MEDLSKLLYHVDERNTLEVCKKPSRMSFGDFVIKSFVDVAAPSGYRLVGTFVRGNLYFAIDGNICHDTENITNDEFPNDLKCKIGNVLKVFRTLSKLHKNGHKLTQENIRLVETTIEPLLESRLDEMIKKGVDCSLYNELLEETFENLKVLLSPFIKNSKTEYMIHHFMTMNVHYVNNIAGIVSVPKLNKKYSRKKQIITSTHAVTTLLYTLKDVKKRFVIVSNCAICAVCAQFAEQCRKSCFPVSEYIPKLWTYPNMNNESYKQLLQNIVKATNTI